MSVLAAQAITKSVRPRKQRPIEILRGVDLTLDAGQRVAIVGRSGSGKSTLLSLFGLLSEPSGGSLSIDGEDTRALTDRRLTRLRRDRLGFVFQNYSLVGHLSIEANVALPLRLAGSLSGSAIRERVAAVLSLVGLGDRHVSRPRDLSGGEQQRVAIARALVTRPALVLADEPTGALDAATAASVLACLLTHTLANNAALLLVTHDPLVAKAADSVLVLQDGQLLAPG